MKKNIFLILALCSFVAFAYNQNDLLGAQTNYQAAKANLDKSKDAMTKANQDLANAESAVALAQKRLTDAQSNLAIKKESAVAAKQNFDVATSVHNTAGTTVDNIWKQLNSPQN